MSFTVTLMNNQEELNKITKNPSTVRQVTGNLRDGTSMVDPEIIIEYNGTLNDCNYMWIPEFHRYYFITDIESVRTGLWKVYAHCDVLKTYANGILACEGVIARQENMNNLYLNDSAFKVYSNPRTQVANFPNKFSGEDYVLVMKGTQNYTPSS